MEVFKYLNNLAFAFNHSSDFIILCLAPPHELDHPLFSPPPHELKPNSAHARKPVPILEKGRGLVVWVQIQRPLEKYEINPMNMTTRVGKHRFGKGDRR